MSSRLTCEPLPRCKRSGNSELEAKQGSDQNDQEQLRTFYHPRYRTDIRIGWRVEVSTSEISQNPRGRILENPGRITFPSTQPRAVAGRLALTPACQLR